MIKHNAPIFYTTLKPVETNTADIYMRILIKHESPIQAAQSIWKLYQRKQELDNKVLLPFESYKIITQLCKFDREIGYCEYVEPLHYAISPEGEVFLGNRLC